MKTVYGHPLTSKPPIKHVFCTQPQWTGWVKLDESRQFSNILNWTENRLHTDIVGWACRRRHAASNIAAPVVIKYFLKNFCGTVSLVWPAGTWILVGWWLVFNGNFQYKLTTSRHEKVTLCHKMLISNRQLNVYHLGILLKMYEFWVMILFSKMS